MFIYTMMEINDVCLQAIVLLLANVSNKYLLCSNTRTREILFCFWENLGRNFCLSLRFLWIFLVNLFDVLWMLINELIVNLGELSIDILKILSKNKSKFLTFPSHFPLFLHKISIKKNLSNSKRNQTSFHMFSVEFVFAVCTLHLIHF